MKIHYLLIITFLNLFLSSCKKATQDVKSSQKELLSFNLLSVNNPALSSDITGDILNGTISIILPSDLSKNLIASFSSSNKSKVYIGSVEQQTAITKNDFSNPIDYKVIAEDGSFKIYTATVTFRKSSKSELKSFSFPRSINSTLTSDIIGIINGNKIDLSVPPGTPKILIASFANSEQSKVYVGTTEQKSGITSTDFSNPVDYKVIAEDSSVSVYSVNVTFFKSSSKELLTFSFLKSLNPDLPFDISGSISTASVSIIVPPGTSLTLIPSFTSSDKSHLYVDGIEQQSGLTRMDFLKTINYKIVAEDSSSVNYSVNVVRDIFSELDNTITDMMRENDVPGLSIAIVKNEKLVYVHSYGYADKDNSEVVTANSLFRVASVSKPITGIAILKLLQEGRLSLNQTVFGAKGILGNKYGTPHSESKKDQITVKHLLDHTSGWTNEPTDPLFWNLNWSFKELITDLVLNRSLKNNPGDSSAYMNFNYCVLGRIIEKITGMPYEQYVKSTVLAPCGITAMKVGSTLTDRYPNEVKYFSSSFSPYSMNVQRLDAAGGWIASATDLMRLMVRIDRENYKSDIVTVAVLNQMYFGYYNWIFYGALAGTASAISRVDNEFSFSFILNHDLGTETSKLYDKIKQLILARKTWPAYDLF